MSSNAQSYYQQHREKSLQRSHEYYVKNKEKILEYNRQYYQTHKEKIYESQKDNQRQWNNDNRIKINEYKRNWRRIKMEEDEKANICITVKTNYVVAFD